MRAFLLLPDRMKPKEHNTKINLTKWKQKHTEIDLGGIVVVTDVVTDVLVKGEETESVVGTLVTAVGT